MMTPYIIPRAMNSTGMPLVATVMVNVRIALMVPSIDSSPFHDAVHVAYVLLKLERTVSDLEEQLHQLEDQTVGRLHHFALRGLCLNIVEKRDDVGL